MRISAILGLTAVVKTAVPGFQCTPTYVRNQTGNYPLMGEMLEFDPIICTVMLDEKWETYKSIQNWFYSLRSPKMLKTHQADRPSRANILLSLRGNQGGPNLRIMFYDVKPTMMSQIELNVQQDETIVSMFDLTMVYSYFEFLNDSELAEGFGVDISA